MDKSGKNYLWVFFFLQLMNKCSYGINKPPDGNVSLNPMF